MNPNPQDGSLPTLLHAVRRADAALTALVDARGVDAHGEPLPFVRQNVSDALKQLRKVLQDVDR